MPKAKITKKSGVVSQQKKAKKSLWGGFVSFAKRPLGMLVIFVVLFGAVGGYFVFQSSASTAYLSSYGCKQRGRVWTGSTTSNPCANKCIAAGYVTVYSPYTKTNVRVWAQGSGYLVYASPYNYCSAAVTPASVISYDKCWNSLNRLWVYQTGCARDWRRISWGVQTLQCRYSSYYYWQSPTGSSGYDFCSPN